MDNIEYEKKLFFRTEKFKQANKQVDCEVK
jgi:hypothetical protein